MLNCFKNLGESHILLTGGTGFFGKNLLKKIQELNNIYSSNIKVTLLSRNPSKFIKEFPELIDKKNLSFIKGDIRSFVIGKNENYDFVIHGATEASAKLERENPAEMYSVITDGTENLLNQIRGKAKKLLFISSGGVYGEQPSNLSYIPETYLPLPTTVYGKGKLKAEKLCLDSNIPSVIARCFTFVGPYLPLDIHFAIGNFIYNCIRNEPVIIKGDGKAVRSYMYSEDLVEWLLKILVNGKNGEIYNVGSDKEITISELANTIKKCLNSNIEIKILGNSITGSSNRYVPAIEKAKSELNLQIKTNLEEAIKKTFDLNKSVYYKE